MRGLVSVNGFNQPTCPGGQSARQKAVRSTQKALQLISVEFNILSLVFIAVSVYNVLMYGFMRVACASASVSVGNCEKNAGEIISLIERSEKDGVSLVVFPELCITGYTCSDLFFQKSLQESALKALARIALSTKSKELTAVVGLPFAFENNLYNVAAVCSQGNVVALVPKSHIPNYCEFYEKRHFTSAFSGIKTAFLLNEQNIPLEIPFGTDLLFCDTKNPNVSFAVEICEDLWVPVPPSVTHCQNGATIIANLSASNETVGKSDYRKLLVQSHSAKNMCAYLYADAGVGESTTDMVFSAHNLIGENGLLLAENTPFSQQTYCTADIDTECLLQDRRKNTSFSFNNQNNQNRIYKTISVCLPELTKSLCRNINPYPFIPQDSGMIMQRCKEITDMQSAGLLQRLRHIGCKTAVIGISGGLDSTLAFLITVQAFIKLNLDLKNIIAVTMPCFGTSDRTYRNACTLTTELGTTLREIPIAEAVNLHFKDIGHDSTVHDTTFENAQARERTQVLMDVANACNGIVIGTGDLSESALGWATYNGDHMSMYAVNASVPKTLVRHLVRFFEHEAMQKGNQNLAQVLHDVSETPVSPELIPLKDGKSTQATEEILGSYDLHDFFLYFFLRWGFSPEKICFLAEHAFHVGKKDELFSKTEIKNRLTLFIKRFFSQQFKRSCMPDGPKIGSVSLSPRGDWRSPSDACCDEWLSNFLK